MTSARSRMLSHRVLISVTAVALFMATAFTASAQAPPDLFTRAETLTLSDGTPAAGLVSLSGDTAVVSTCASCSSGGVGHDDVVHVFERESSADHWVHSATLVASDGTSGFGRTVATDGMTTVVGAGLSPDDGAAYVFQRIPGSQAWQETARLTGDQNPAAFGSSVAVSGSTIVVGASTTGLGAPSGLLLPGPGVVYVFERDLGGLNAWGESARLMGPPHPIPGLFDFFGASIAIDHDTLLVGARAPFRIPPGGDPALRGNPTAYVFSRHLGRENLWELVATREVGRASLEDPTPAAEVSITGDTALIGQPNFISGPGTARIIQRDRGGPNAWGEVTVLPDAFLSTMGIGGDFAALGVRIFPESGFAVFARHQGGMDVWGEVARIGVGSSQPPHVAISGDTILVGPQTSLIPFQGSRIPIDVYVADTDRDALRDGIDACPRDPLNNVEGGCTRNSAAYLVLDDLITLGDVTAETHSNEFRVTATFTNTSDTPIGNPFFEVTELTGGNLLMNADAGPGGTGATLSPDVGDGILSAGESTTVTFIIGLETHEAFRFFVSVRGEAGP